MKNKIFTLLFAVTASVAFSQNVITLRPSGGLNDGTDNGGATTGKETQLYEGDPKANYASNNVMASLPISNCNQTHSVLLIQFDLSTLPAVVDSVFVGFTHIDQTNYCLSSCDADWYFAACKTAWKENTACYDTTPAVDTAFYGPINIKFPDTSRNREYNITTMYRLWKAGTVVNNGFKIYSPTVACNNAAIMFYTYTSDDTAASKRPYLKVYYHPSTGLNAEMLSGNLFPNPSKDNATLQLIAPYAQQVEISLSDMCGRIVYQSKQQLSGGINNIQLNTNELSAGSYLVRAETAIGSFISKLLISK